MKITSILFFCFLTWSCTNTYGELQLIKERAAIFDKYESSLFKDIRVNILRNNSNPIEYELRKKSGVGFAVFQIYPDKKIFKNLTSDSISMKFIHEFSNFNYKKDVVIHLLENIDERKSINIKIYDKIACLFKGDILNQRNLNVNDSIIYLSNDWKCVLKPFVSE